MPIKQTLNFDEINHTFTYKNNTTSLNPLSFKLLKALADSNEEILSVNALISKVWQNNSVTSETLKQRVFVLRKAITESGIEGLIIQSVRGEGYRLILEHEPITSSEHGKIIKENKAYKFASIHKKTLLIFVAFIVLAISANIVFNTTKQKPYVNNRIALWTNVKPYKLPKSATTIYSNWNQKLLKEMKENKINIVFSERQENVLVPVQARRNRIALISYFEVFDRNNKTIINLSIVEPKTATVLRANSFELLPDFDAESLLNSHLNGINKLLASNKLNLSKQHKENPKHRIWLLLKELANAK